MPRENQPAAPVALLIPHYNQREALAESLASVTFANDLLIVIVDDGSSDNHLIDRLWVQSLSIPFQVHVIQLAKNAGITHALNTGLKFILEETSCDYVARLDCGDIQVSERLDRQYRFLEQNPSIALCGSWCQIINEDCTPLYTLRPPLAHKAIQRKMLSDNCFIHPTVMFRTDAARDIGYYPDHYPAAEDYAYFSLFVSRFKTANLPHILIKKIRSESSISYRCRRQQLVSRLCIIAANFKFHYQSFRGIFKASVFLILPASWIERLKQKLLS